MYITIFGIYSHINEQTEVNLGESDKVTQATRDDSQGQLFSRMIKDLLPHLAALS